MKIANVCLIFCVGCMQGKGSIEICSGDDCMESDVQQESMDDSAEPTPEPTTDVEPETSPENSDTATSVDGDGDVDDDVCENQYNLQDPSCFVMIPKETIPKIKKREN